MYNSAQRLGLNFGSEFVESERNERLYAFDPELTEIRRQKVRWIYRNPQRKKVRFRPCNTTWDRRFRAKTERPLIVRNLPVIEAPLSRQGIHVPIGRDVLADCVFNYNGAKKIHSRFPATETRKRNGL